MYRDQSFVFRVQSLGTTSLSACALRCTHFWGKVFFGRGQPLYCTLPFDEIAWFDEKGGIRRCDWSKIAYFCMCPVWILLSQSQRRISPFSSNQGISPNDSVNYSGRPLPLLSPRQHIIPVPVIWYRLL